MSYDSIKEFKAFSELPQEMQWMMQLDSLYSERERWASERNKQHVHKVLVANETEAQWKAMTEDEQFNTCDIVVKDFLVELAHIFEQYRPKT